MLIGRDAELATLDSCLDRAAGGRANALRLTAEPGMGKTALLDELARRAEARGFTVARVTAVEVEAGIPAAGLGVVLAMLGSKKEASTSALLDAVLTSVQAGPLLLAVDDAQWLDDLSLTALAFATRRLLADPVAVVIAGRADTRERPALAGIPVLDVPPLDSSDGVALLRQSMPAVPDIVARGIVDALGGVPLAICDAPRILDPEVLSGAARLPSPLPVSRAVQHRYARGFAELEGDERLAVVLLASDDSSDSVVLSAALAECGLTMSALQGGERVGLVELGRTPRVRHPLARAAIHSAAEPIERRRAHSILATVCAARGDGDRAIRHRCAAAIAPDQDLADALEQHARSRLEQPGGSDEAVSLALLGAEMAGETERRCELLTLAAEHARADVAVPLIERVAQESTDPFLRARCTLVSTRIDPQWTPDEITRALSGLADDEIGPALARERDLQLVWAYMNSNDTSGLVGFAERFDNPAETLEDWNILAALGFAFTFVADHHRAVPLLRKAADLSAKVDPTTLPVKDVTDWAIIPGWLGDDAAHGTRFRRMNEILRRTGRPEDAADAAFFMSERLRREGSWPMTEALLHETIDLTHAMDADSGVGYARLASLLSYRGDEAATNQAIDAAQLAFTGSGERWHPLWLAQTRGSLALTLGRPREATAALADLPTVPFLGRGARDAVALGLADLVEAHMLAGSSLDADRTADELARRLDGIADPLGPALVARCRALTSPADADDCFAESLEHHARTSEAFEAARTALYYGQHLRRTRRPKRAREHLASALAVFEHLRVDPWTERAQRELRAAGQHSQVRVPNAVSLTPQELRVAMAVREGLTNDEVAGALFISVKTVEFHLGRVYRKLGIRSRGGLADALDRAGIA